MKKYFLILILGILAIGATTVTPPAPSIDYRKADGFNMTMPYRGLTLTNAFFTITAFNTAERVGYITYTVGVYASKAQFTADRIGNLLGSLQFTKELNPKDYGNAYTQFYAWIVKQTGYTTAVIDLEA